MMKSTISLLSVLLCLQCFSQHIGLPFQEAENKGFTLKHLDSVYAGAIHSDSALSVFKTDEEQELLQQAYIKLLQDFGKFLSANNFNWNKPTRCFNRIYFNEDGTIDYFLYNFLGKPEDGLSNEQQKEFNVLLNQFIKDYKFGITAKVKFAQCSPTTYMPKQ